ncbi:class I SAM-dependent methyltransferase [Aureimonas jatrophae]|uniref:Methyltransferase domain-containing protein n=1 Tax=Aureimonas jatrophae TaxID=1166073 RepID=A0A1H0BZA4_9HYPH|nr:class I SAM-dependent methyltransferase [Aureimonas jatrophae]MBB3948995.1 SAM-dependent methyltransferase [Aureimonas jatrophae]SDN50886.1 Methyltransferase domain-containing protein [Aureimonas jatrophae]
MDPYRQANLLNWNERAALHSTDTTGSYRIAKVLAGGSSLHAIEEGEIGDITGLDVVHLQCHIGLDTLSLKHLGARSVAGLDFSPVAIAAANDFARRAGTEARFVEGVVEAAPDLLGRACFDLAFVTWGAINWLSDIELWARTVAALLRPGGRLYLLEGHPQMNQCELRDGRLAFEFPHTGATRDPLAFDEAQTYTGDARKLEATRNYEWIHPLGSIVGALLAAGLRLDFLHEHDRIAWRAFEGMVEDGEDLFRLPPGIAAPPLAFSIGASRPR